MEHCTGVVFVLICCLMGNFILINDRERIVMAAEVQISASSEWKRPSREAFMTQNGHSATQEEHPVSDYEMNVRTVIEFD